MARTLTEIYNEAKKTKDKYLALSEFDNDSKMSVINSLLWVSAACIWTFETILDVYTVDMALALQNRINGTPAYYTSALLKYQKGDQLVVAEDGASFAYANIDEEKRIITRVSYSEFNVEGFHDKGLIYKVASGSPGAYTRISSDDVIGIQAYLDQIKFAGTYLRVVSREGDVLCPKLTVYHDGAIPTEEVYQNIENELKEFISNLQYDSILYTQKVIDAIQKAEHVVDVYIDSEAGQGVFVAQYNDDNNLIEVNPGSSDPDKYLQLVQRAITSSAGFFKESSKEGQEANIPKWKETIILKIEGEK